MHPLQLAPNAPPAPPVHPRLRTAFNVLGYCEAVATGRRARGGEPNGRDLIAGEIAARNAALELIRHYLSGEIELDPAAAPAWARPAAVDDDPHATRDRHPAASATSPIGAPHPRAPRPGDSGTGPAAGGGDDANDPSDPTAA